MSSTTGQAIRTLRDLTGAISASPGFAAVVAALKARQRATLDGAWGSSSALAAAALQRETSGPLLIVLPRMKDVDEFALELESFAGISPTIFPAWESLPREQDVSDVIFGSRLRVLNELAGSPPPALIVAPFPALLQPVPSRADRLQATRRLSVGEELDSDEFLHWLSSRGFARVPAVELPGEFSLRGGGILDIFPPDAVDPLRIELFGDEIESIRRFDVETQRKLEDLPTAALTVIAPSGQSADANGSSQLVGEHFLDALPAETWVILTELQELVDEAKQYLGRLEERGHTETGLYGIHPTLAKCAGFPLLTLAGIAIDKEQAHCRLPVETVERIAGPRNEALHELAAIVQPEEQVLIACQTEGERLRLAELVAEAELEIADRLTLCQGFLQRGFRLIDQRLLALSEHEIFNRTTLRPLPARKKRVDSRVIDSFLDLRENDLVVHLSHGIGRYRGMILLEKTGQVEEHLIVEFRDSVKLYVPVSLIHLVQKYIGSSKHAPQLSKVNGSAWAKKKEKVAEAISDMAADMLELQAARAGKPGIAYPADSEWQQEFETSFPYTETDDQLRAITEIKQDMEREQPMDRLICGDVGFGKTEVAMRAAFKAITAGRQVAVLVPTTVLAEQHYRTFTDRMAEYPVSVASLSRFKSKGEQKKIIDRMALGQVDLVIGTHRLVQKDVRFSNLGLVIIDEEQRFGVEAKEKLKQLRLETDVLTLSATPIPRTLHLSLLGIRDISNLETAPQDRQAVETRLQTFDEGLIRRAIIRELNRNGQVYFVHNRVHNIRQMADRLQAIVPEARIGIGHGQMKGEELEAAMLSFVQGEIDILVCTTIIESGLDIPNANTMFINEAGHYGLAEMHQLRGRVGRYKHRAYCYLLVEDGKSLTETGAKRLEAIQEYSDLGAGFKIAMRDLEIRGAGNILGTEQSGHISTVGYELYCQLLEDAVRQLRKMPKKDRRHVSVDLPVSAWFPETYIPPGRHKVDIYRKLSALQEAPQLDELAEELRDRFGPIPPEGQRLLELRRLHIYAWNWRIEDIRLDGKYAVFRYRHAKRMEQLAARWRQDLKVVDSQRAYWFLTNADARDDELLDELKSVLRPDP